MKHNILNFVSGKLTIFIVIGIVSFFLFTSSSVYASQERVWRYAQEQEDKENDDQKDKEDDDQKDKEDDENEYSGAHNTENVHEKVIEAKKQLQQRKEEVLIEYKKGEINAEEAKQKVLLEKEKLVTQTKEEIKIDQEKQVRGIIKKFLDQKLIKIKTLSSEKQRAVYEKLISKVDTLIITATEKRKFLLGILKDLLEEEKNTL